jgi:cyanate lyase
MDTKSTEWKTAYTKAIADVLYLRKAELRMTFDELEVATGITEGSLKRIINGHRAINMSNFIVLAVALRFDTPADVLTQADTRMSKTSE